ncbi:MAG: GGDEF domain-containing protein [Burkholderiales bacterium]|nr:GGDEF domain-containing protein [Burkholderiales bacterium]
MLLYRQVHGILSGKPPGLVFALSVAYILAVATLDWYTGATIVLSVFYLPAIAIAAWYGNRLLAHASAVLAGVSWMVGTRAWEVRGVDIGLWNAAIAIATFMVIAKLIADLKQTMAKIHEQATTDSLTGALNRRGFMDRLNAEIELQRRHGLPFSVAYCDLDDFKEINDRFGHQVGDEVLRTFVDACRGRLRKTDVVGRVGGDEFALLLFGATEAASLDALKKLNADVLQKLQDRGWPVTISIGVVAFPTSPANAEELICKTDEVMYRAKRGGKNALGSMTYLAESSPGVRSLRPSAERDTSTLQSMRRK